MKKISPNFLLNNTSPLKVGMILFVVLVVLFFRATFAGLLHRALSPLVVYTPLPTFFAYVHSKAWLVDENNKLKVLLASTTALVADRQTLFQENKDLKSRMGRVITSKVVLAGILMRPPGVPYDTLVIDAGLAEGVVVGAYVAAGGTTYIGRVDEVYASTARVVLFSASGESHQGLLTAKTGEVIPVVVDGQGGGSLVAEVPAHTKVAVGDTVLLPGIAGGLTALVSHIEAENGESFRRVYLRLPINPLELRFVEVTL